MSHKHLVTFQLDQLGEPRNPAAGQSVIVEGDIVRSWRPMAAPGGRQRWRVRADPGVNRPSRAYTWVLLPDPVRAWLRSPKTGSPCDLPGRRLLHHEAWLYSALWRTLETVRTQVWVTA